MICPKCHRSFYFLKGTTFESQARCLKCGFEAMPEKPSYESYHENLYSSREYKRTPKTDPQMKRIFKTLEIEKKDVVIDLGCGVGDYTVEADRQSANAAGYDLNVTAAKRKYPGVNFFEHDFDKPIPVPDNSVDKLISINVIEHVENWEFFLQECCRVLKPGGMVALSTANRSFLLHDFHFDKTHLHEWTCSDFSTLVSKYFKMISVKKDCAAFNLYPLNMILQFFLKPDLTFVGKKPTG